MWDALSYSGAIFHKVQGFAISWLWAQVLPMGSRTVLHWRSRGKKVGLFGSTNRANLIADTTVTVVVKVRCRSIPSLFQFTWPWGTVISSVYPCQGGAYDLRLLHGDTGAVAGR